MSDRSTNGRPHRFRYAPTPSRDLHLGNGLAALIGWAQARLHQGKFILRIEDIDSTRCRTEYEESSLKDLRWLGIDWDEGPDIGGPHGPYRQSERMEHYDGALDLLNQQSMLYPCRCSRADIRAAQSAPHHPMGGPYPGTCRPPADAVAPAAFNELEPHKGGYRLHVHHLGANAEQAWTDLWLGAQREDIRGTCGDFLLGRHSSPSYQLAVVVDDQAMGITDVIRGEDLMASTGRQILLHTLLGKEAPRFAHHPILTDSTGKKLSKRDASISLATYRENGADPKMLIAHLAHGIGLTDGLNRPMSAQDFLSSMKDPTGWRNGRALWPIDELS